MDEFATFTMKIEEVNKAFDLMHEGKRYVCACRVCVCVFAATSCRVHSLPTAFVVLLHFDAAANRSEQMKILIISLLVTRFI